MYLNQAVEVECVSVLLNSVLTCQGVTCGLNGGFNVKNPADEVLTLKINV